MPSSGALGDGANSQRHREYLRALRMRQIQVLLVQIAVLVVFLGAWHFAATLRIVDPFITSQPKAIAQKLLQLTSDGSLAYHFAITVIETLIGFGIGTVLGILISGLLWWSDFLSDVTDPYIVVLNATP
jgi:NitT/TauT family transport system permease protein